MHAASAQKGFKPIREGREGRAADMAPHDERIAAFGKRLPEELEDGRDRSLRNQCGRQVGDRAADESLSWLSEEEPV